MRTFLIVSLLFLSIQKISAYDDKMVSFPNAKVINEYTTRIPFKLIDHLIVVEAELNNKTGNFIIDTGSETLILNKVHFKQGLKSNKVTYGVNSDIDLVLEKRLKELKLNSFAIKNVKSDIIDLSHIEKAKKMNLLGVIGFSVIKDYEVFIDLYLNQITLTRIDKNGNNLDKNVYLETIVDSIPFYLRKHTIVLKGTVGNKELKLGLDSAAEFNQLNKSVNKSVLKHFKPQRRLKLSGAGKKEIEVLAGKLYRLKLSESVYFGPMHTIITNLSKMNEVFGVNLDGVLGYEFLRQKRTIINYKKQMLYFVKTPLPRY